MQVDPYMPEFLRHAANEEEWAGRSHTAGYLRTAASAIEHLLQTSPSVLPDHLPEWVAKRVCRDGYVWQSPKHGTMHVRPSFPASVRALWGACVRVLREPASELESQLGKEEH